MHYKKIDSGVGGWLLVLILCMTVMWPLMAFGALLSSLEGLEQVYLRAPHTVWIQGRTVMWLIFCVSVALSAGGGWILYRVHAGESVYFAVCVIWIAWPLMSLFMVIAAVLILKDPRIGSAYSPVIRNLVFSVIGAIAATMYLTRSRRVQNTYRLPIYV